MTLELRNLLKKKKVPISKFNTYGGHEGIYGACERLYIGQHPSPLLKHVNEKLVEEKCRKIFGRKRVQYNISKDEKGHILVNFGISDMAAVRKAGMLEFKRLSRYDNHSIEIDPEGYVTVHTGNRGRTDLTDEQRKLYSAFILHIGMNRKAYEKHAEEKRRQFKPSR